MAEEGQLKSDEEQEMPAGLFVAMFIVVIVVSVGILSLLLVRIFAGSRL